jgi:hypothetical protein
MRLVLFCSIVALAVSCAQAQTTVGDNGKDAAVDANRQDVGVKILMDMNLSLQVYYDTQKADLDTAPPDTYVPPPKLDDFPIDPVADDPGIPANVPTLFETPPRSGNAPCLLSPEPKTLMPNNWLRPRFEWVKVADENVYEITISKEGFAHPYRVYTKKTTYTMDPGLWDSLRMYNRNEKITAKIRGITLSQTGTVQNAPTSQATTDFTIAPVDAPGKIVYWAIAGSGVLRGFGVGEEGVQTVLTAAEIQPPAIDTVEREEKCIGCHAATPDGYSVGFSLGPKAGTYFDSIAKIGLTNHGGQPEYVTAGQMTVLRNMRGIPAYSKSHWKDGDHIALLMDGAKSGSLVWVNLDTDGEQGVIERTGDPRGASEPTFSHDGTKIAYVSANGINDGRFGTGPSDIYVVPYNDRKGGASEPLEGAADDNYTEYYPAYSPDDAYVTFTRVQGISDSYSNRNAEIFVVPAEGGKAIRFGANDPIVCPNQGSFKSPGVTNDWSKWSPEATVGPDGVTYYWLIFSSSRRANGGQQAQLFITPMTVKDGTVNVDYPALYLWNQPAKESNHTPSWDHYRIPDIPPPPPPPPPIPLL